METNEKIDWVLIYQVAKSLGVKIDTLYKWKERGAVPYRYHLPLIQQSGGLIPASWFALPSPPSPIDGSAQI